MPTTPKARQIRPVNTSARREAYFNKRVMELPLIKAVIVRVVHARGFGFLRGENEDHDTFFHANCVRYTEHELAKRKKEKALIGDAFNELVVGLEVLYLPAVIDKEGKGPRARWIGVGVQK